MVERPNMRFTEWVKKKFTWPSIGGGYSNYGSGRRGSGMMSWFLPGTRQDWVIKAGDLWKNSVVSLCLNWIVMSVPEAKLVVKVKTDKGIDIEIPGHPVTQLLKRPNRYVSLNSTMAGMVISWFCDGNTYLRKLRSNSGQVIELIYVPHYQMWPRWNEDGSKFISYYEYSVNGVIEEVHVDDVIHIRNGIDPDNIRKGLSPLKAQLRQICQDNENSTFGAVLMENFGIPGLMISADDPNADIGELANPDSEQSKQFTRILQARTVGDERGKPIFAPVGVKIEKLGFSPEELVLDKLIAQPAWRICSAFNINSLVVGLPNENQGTYDNFEQAERGAWNNCIIPMLSVFCEELSRQLLETEPQYNYQPGQFVFYDTKYIRALQVNLQTLIPVIVQACGGTCLTPNEARQILLYEPMEDEEMDKLRISQNAGAQAFAQADDDAKPKDKPKE